MGSESASTLAVKARPEVILLAPAAGDDLMFQKLVDMLVEYGIDFTADAPDRLPQRLPEELAGCKAIIMDAARLDADAVPAAWRDRVVTYRRPSTFNWNDERPLWIVLSALLTQRGVTPQHPAFLARHAARPDREVILGQAEACLRLEPAWCRRWCDATLVRLEAIWSAATLYERPDLQEAVKRCVDDTLVAYADAPVYGRGETSDGRFKHPIFPGLLLPLWQATGVERYRDAALPTMETLNEARAIAREWREGTPFLQTESLDRKPWQWAMRARWCGEPEFYAPAVGVMQAGFATLFDPEKQLWAHYGIRGSYRGLAWGRGQGWALYGLVGLLEHLPTTHPDYETMRSWLDLTAEGLRRTQDPVTGLWHNVMDEPGTRLETSGTAKCVRHLARAWRLGLCRAPFVPDLLARAWHGLKAHTFNNRSCTRCYGTGPGPDVGFYATLGTGGSYTAAVQAGAEYVRAFGPLVKG